MRRNHVPRLRLYLDATSADRLAKLAAFFRADAAAITRLALADLWERIEPVERPEATGEGRAAERRRIQPYREARLPRLLELDALASEVLKTSAADYADLRRGMWRPSKSSPAAKKRSA